MGTDLRNSFLMKVQRGRAGEGDVGAHGCESGPPGLKVREVGLIFTLSKLTTGMATNKKL